MAEIDGFEYADRCAGCLEIHLRADVLAAGIAAARQQARRNILKVSEVRELVYPGSKPDVAERTYIDQKQAECSEVQAEKRRKFRRFLLESRLHCPGAGELIEEPDGGIALRECRMPGRHED